MANRGITWRTKFTKKELEQEWTKENLWEIENRYQMTPDAVASLAGYSKSHYEQMRTGSRRVTPRFISAVKEALRIS